MLAPESPPLYRGTRNAEFTSRNISHRRHLGDLRFMALAWHSCAAHRTQLEQRRSPKGLSALANLLDRGIVSVAAASK
jgi:hypothetical protein